MRPYIACVCLCEYLHQRPKPCMPYLTSAGIEGGAGFGGGELQAQLQFSSTQHNLAMLYVQCLDHATPLCMSLCLCEASASAAKARDATPHKCGDRGVGRRRAASAAAHQLNPAQPSPAVCAMLGPCDPALHVSVSVRASASAAEARDATPHKCGDRGRRGVWRWRAVSAAALQLTPEQPSPAVSAMLGPCDPTLHEPLSVRASASASEARDATPHKCGDRGRRGVWRWRAVSAAALQLNNLALLCVQRWDHATLHCLCVPV